MNIIQELIGPRMEIVVDSEGNAIVKPIAPTSLEIRAAKTIYTLAAKLAETKLRLAEEEDFYQIFFNDLTGDVVIDMETL